MRVLFLLLTYPKPDESPNMYSDLIAEFAMGGHKVTVVSAAKEKEPTTFQREKDIEVLRVKTQKIFNVHPILKGIATVRIPYQFKKAIQKYLSSNIFDLVLTPTPPITFAAIVSWLKKKHPLKSYLILRDIFPQNARDLGMMKNPLLFDYFRKKEKELYHNADIIGCMSQGNIDYVIKHNPEVNQTNLVLLPNWQKEEAVTEKDEYIKKQYGLEGKFIAIFGGNIGEPQKIDNIIDLARTYQHNTQIVFLVIGRGAQKNYLEQMKTQHNLDNLIIKDTIPRSDYQKLVCSADIGLISLSEKFTIPNIPSKTLSYFNAKLPILAAIDANTDYGKLLEESGAGLWSVSGDLDKYTHNFNTLYHDSSLRKQMGENGYQYMLKYLTVNTTYQTIINQVSAI